ncbi:O-methyltransferase [Haloglomus litoreum]|uniref:O-methyltransferase n=1 Tax=Haloglomus litoreum TaxID=3034026 RepID=UPI0023E8ECC7|nr:O-methyltransferase [Haloglomus sp. DT116]
MDTEEFLPSVTASFAEAVGPEADAVVEEMDARADREGFPTVGPAVGGWLRLLARAVDAERVFEFGSGYGYSAYWMAPALPPDGELVLTEFDEDELADAREYLERGGYADRAVFEAGDALATVEGYRGPFDLVLLDHEKERYAEAFEAVREKVPVGGVVCADNAMTAGPIEFDALRRLVGGAEDADDVDTTDATRGIADYLETVRADPAFETTLLPLGEGLSVSIRVE